MNDAWPRTGSLYASVAYDSDPERGDPRNDLEAERLPERQKVIVQGGKGACVSEERCHIVAPESGDFDARNVIGGHCGLLVMCDWPRLSRWKHFMRFLHSEEACART